MSYLRDKLGVQVSAMGLAARHSLATAICAAGKGLHSGLDVHISLLPAPAGTGIVFHRTDLSAVIPARFDHVSDTRLCTVVSHNGASVGTVEHLMAAISACGIDDLIIEVDAPELPVFDGSAAPFMFLLESAGIAAHPGRIEQIEVLRTVRVEQGAAFAELRPHLSGETGLHLSLAIEFAAAAIGAQAYTMRLSHEAFSAELASARTFTQAGEIEAMRLAGLAKGGSLANAIVVDGAKILNPEGLRFPDEFVRHKLLDVVGDLALAGAPISGRFIGSRTGHRLNNEILRALFADTANYRFTAVALPAERQLSAA